MQQNGGHKTDSATLARVTHSPKGPHIPANAQRLRLPLWERSQTRLRERYGFDLNSPDANARITALRSASPQDSNTILLEASVLATRGENAQAEQQVRAALAINPELARAHTTLATLLVQSGRVEEGLQSAQRAVELDAADPVIQYNLGLAQWTSGNHRAAQTAFRQAEDLLAAETQSSTGSRPRRRWPWSSRPQ